MGKEKQGLFFIRQLHPSALICFDIGPLDPAVLIELLENCNASGDIKPVNIRMRKKWLDRNQKEQEAKAHKIRN